MFLYLAVTSNTHAQRQLVQARYPFLLSTFAYPAMLANLEASAYRPERLVIDSGAFTAWTTGRRINLDDYRRYCADVAKRYTRNELIIVNLDVIPGAFGRASTQAERVVGMADSLRHADILRGDGYRVMEVYHQDEPPSFFDHLLERRAADEVLGLSPRNDVSLYRRRRWLKAVYGHMYTTAPLLPPCHILAGTGEALLRENPVYSADSSSYNAVVRYGHARDTSGRIVALTKVFPSSRHHAALSVMLAETIQFYGKLSDHITAVWARRGVVWPDPPAAISFPTPSPASPQEAVHA